MTPKLHPHRVRVQELIISDHARQRANERLGVNPPPAWWTEVAKGIITGRFPACGEVRDSNGARPHRVPAIDSEGTEVELVVVAARTHTGNGCYRIAFVSIWTELEFWT